MPNEHPNLYRGRHYSVVRRGCATTARGRENEAEKSKPHPDIFEVALKKLEDPVPKSCVVIGDTPYDVTAAKKAHLRTVGLLSGGFPESALREAGAVAIYADAQALLEAYQRSGDSALDAAPTYRGVGSAAP